MKRLLLIVFFSFMLSACGSDKAPTDVYDQMPETEITSQPMQVNDSALQTELSKHLSELKGDWTSASGMIIRFEDRFLTFVDLESDVKLSFISYSAKDFGNFLNFVSYDSTQTIESVSLILERASSEDVVGFTLGFGEYADSPTRFTRANTSVDYQDSFLKTSH